MESIDRIIQRLQRGETEVFVHIINEYQGVVLNLAYRMTGDYEEALDLSQEIFIKVYRNIRKFDPARRFFPWLFAIALNLIRDYLKKRHIEKNSRLGSPNPITAGAFEGQGIETSDPETELIRLQKAVAVRNALLELPVILREAVVMRYYSGLKFSEISEISVISLSAAKMRVYRGLCLMQERLGGELTRGG